MARHLPTGTVTFLFTDIEGSTRLSAMLGGDFADLLEAHRHHIRTAVESHGGQEVGTEGDGCFIAFERVTDALAAAVDAQLSLTKHAWPHGASVRVRMGVHTGEAQVVADNYVGYAVHEASRVSAAAHGGQIVLSKLSRDLAASSLPPSTTVRSLGVFRLKDIAMPAEIFQLEHPELPRSFPSLRTTSFVPTNLPGQLTSFVGRGSERDGVIGALSTSRLVTLTGPGGVGKTRLAVESAMSLRDAHPDGVWMVDLAPVSDPELCAPTIGSAVGMRDGGDRPPTDALVDHLASRSTLVVLDNCEHVTGACAAIGDRLLRACVDLKLLATSRQPLGVAGEVVFPVPPMDVADDGGSSDAVTLFVDRVRLADPTYTPSDEDMTHVGEICRRLDGLPLAIELAAAHMRMLAPSEISARLGDRFSLLTRGPRTATERQQTLRATLDWGYELLDERERVLLSRLAIFTGTFSLEGAEQICSGGELDRPVVYDVLSSLVDKSLVMRSLRAGRTRYWLLETIREYAMVKLAEQQAPVRTGVAAPPRSETEPDASAATLFRREGEVWAIGPRARPVRLRDAKGLRYLAVLLRQPGTDIGVLDLIGAVEGDDAASRRARDAVGDAGEVLDAHAVRAYRRRLEEIAAETDDARVFGDAARVSALEAEAKALSTELAGALGLGGRHRKQGSAVERARLSVTKALRSAVAKLTAENPELGRHLNASIRTGTRCGYFPTDPAPTWEVSG